MCVLSLCQGLATPVVLCSSRLTTPPLVAVVRSMCLADCLLAYKQASQLAAIEERESATATTVPNQQRVSPRTVGWWMMVLLRLPFLRPAWFSAFAVRLPGWFCRPAGAADETKESSSELGRRWVSCWLTAATSLPSGWLAGWLDGRYAE